MPTYLKRLILLFTVLCCFSPHSFPQNESPQQQSKSIILYLKKANNGKRIPPATFIYCEVADDMVFFEPNFEYDRMSVEITGTEIAGVLQRKFTVFEPYVIIPLISGECTIRCTTDAGAVYEGTITL